MIKILALRQKMLPLGSNGLKRGAYYLGALLYAAKSDGTSAVVRPKGAAFLQIHLTVKKIMFLTVSINKKIR